MITSSQRTFCYRFQKLTVTWYKTDINFINLAYCLDIVTGVVIIISIIFLISITSGIMKVRRHNYGYKVQGECPHTINQLEKQHTHLERQIAAFYTDIPRVSRGQAKASTKKILTLAKKNTNTDSFPNWSLTKCFLGEKKKKENFFVLTFPLHLLFLIIFRAYSLPVDLRKEKWKNCMINHIEYFSQSSLYLSFERSRSGQEFYSSICFVKKWSLDLTEIVKSSQIYWIRVPEKKSIKHFFWKMKTVQCFQNKINWFFHFVVVIVISSAVLCKNIIWYLQIQIFSKPSFVFYYTKKTLWKILLFFT